MKWLDESIMEQRRKDLSLVRQRWQKHWAWVQKQEPSTQDTANAKPNQESLAKPHP